MSSLLRDLRFSFRLLLKTPGFSLTAVLVLALGIGANAAVFSLVNAMLLRPLVGSGRPGELVGIYSQDRGTHGYRSFSYPELQDIRQRASVFSEVSGFDVAFVGIGEGDMTRQTMAALVPANYFSTLGTGLMAGRYFSAEEEHPGSGAAVAIVSHAFWKAHGSDPALIGQTVKINARPFTIVGIAPPGFTGTSVLIGMEAWLPFGASALVTSGFGRDESSFPSGDRRNRPLILVGRLKPGVTQEAAAPALQALSAALEREYPAESRNQVITTHSLSRTSITTNPQGKSEMYAPLSIMMGMAVIVLIIASLNLANMMLARGTARRKEIAMRLALGGGRGQVVRQLLVEGALLSLTGGVAGLVLGYWSASLLVRSLVPLSPVPIAFDPSPDVRVALATLAFCALTTIVFALGPAWRLSRTDVIAQIKEQEGAPIASAWRRRFGARNVLVATQIALSLGLLTTAGLFTRGAIEAGKADPGYRFDGQLLASVNASLAGYDDVRGRETFARMLDRLRAVPGVRAASIASVVAFAGFSEGERVLKVGSGEGPRDGRASGAGAVSYSIGNDYFRTLGIPVLRGRDFTAAEVANAAPPQVVIIDEPLARAVFPNEEPVGQHIRFARDEEPARGEGTAEGQPPRPRTMEVVGVVKGLRHDLFDLAPVSHVYLPFNGAYRRSAHFHVAVTGGKDAEGRILQAVRREISAVDPHMPVLALQTLDGHRATSILYWIVRAGANIFAVFGLVAAFLAVVGLYAVKAYVVSRRTREIGIRMALGSSHRGVLWLVLREGVSLTAAGLAAGTLIALGIGQLVGSMLYRVSPFDPQAFGLSALLLAGASLVACYLPARRATRVTPMRALRTE